MGIRKVISIFLVLVLSIQLVPLRQTISWLLGGQATEELAHADDGGKPDDNGKPGDGFLKQYLPVYSPTLVQRIQILANPGLPIHEEELPMRHADDIPTPPPNC